MTDDAVAAAAHRDVQPLGPGEAQRGAYVGDPGAARDQGGLPVDHPVPHPAYVVERLVPRDQYLSVEPGAQPVDRGSLDRCRDERG